MTNFCHCQIIGILGSSKTCVEEELPSVPYSDCEQSLKSIKGAKGSSFNWMKKSNKISNYLSQGKVKLSTKNVSQTLKRTLHLSKRVFQTASLERSLRRSFDVSLEERLLDAYSCSLFTTAGPIKGTIYITSVRLAFHSKKSLKLSTSMGKGKGAKVAYKVSIPLEKVKKATPSESLNEPEEKYVQIVTIDDFEFWFLGFVNYKKYFESLCLVLSGQQ